MIRLYFQSLILYAGNILSDFELAKDIVQEVFLKIWDARSSLEVTTSLKSYLYRAVHNACIDHLRSRKSKNVIHSISFDDVQLRLKVYEISDDKHYFDDLFSEELDLQLQKAIEQLPPQCKEIFLLCRREQLSYNEISERLSVSLSTVKTQMVRAMQKLNDSMKNFLK